MSDGLKIFCASLAVMTSPAIAADDTAAKEKSVPTQEVWGGIDATSDVWLFYSGITLAPWGKGIFGDGWRLRAGGGYGQYTFGYTTYAPNSPNESCGGALQESTFYGNCKRVALKKKYTVKHSYAEALVGYQKQFGELTAKGFVGVSYIDHRTEAPAEIFRAAGAEFGIKGVLEFWLNVGPKGWTSLDLNYSTAHSTGAARWRAGWRVLPDLSIGPEVRYDRNELDDSGRAGLFARYEWPGGEVSLAGGASGTISGSDMQEIGAYATFNVLFQY